MGNVSKIPLCFLIPQHPELLCYKCCTVGGNPAQYMVLTPPMCPMVTSISPKPN